MNLLIICICFVSAPNELKLGTNIKYVPAKALFAANRPMANKRPAQKRSLRKHLLCAWEVDVMHIYICLYKNRGDVAIGS